MERERIRQEKLQRIHKETKDLFDRIKTQDSPSTPTSRFMTTRDERKRLFDETRERLLQARCLPSSGGESNDSFGQFVREHQERFAHMTSTLLGSSVERSPLNTTSTANPGRKLHQSVSQQQLRTHKPLTRCSTELNVNAAAENNPSAAEVVASILNNTDLKQQKKVRTIEIKREKPADPKEGKEVQRSNSGSSGLSSDSSGFSSLNETKPKQGDDEVVAAATAKIVNSSVGVISKNSSSPVTKLQLLQERRRQSEHHPSFANHFGFAARFGRERDFPPGFPNFGHFPAFASSSSNNAEQLQQKVKNNCEQHKKVNSNKMMMTNNNKVAVTKSKSTLEYTKDSQTYRYSTEELTLASYGDSETESDEDDEDFENLDSVSVVAARASSSSSSSSSTSSHNGQLLRGQIAARNHVTSPSLDSGRGDSPESSCNSTLVSASTLQGSSPKKPPRPISAVPSEYSDISTSSCRTSDEGELEEPSKVISNSSANSKETEESPVVSIVVSNVADHHQIDHNEEHMTKEGRMLRVHRIASELLSTEEQYVTVLYLIDQMFHFRVDQENRLSNMFPQDTLPQMFANIKSIYKFHAEFLLPQLRERMEKWHSDESCQRIGDIVVKFSPFFKMYTEYVKNFDNAINTINNTYAKNAKFAAIMDEIHAMPECGNLSLQHHMLTPIQRIPRYEMLLKDYLKKLPEDSFDRADSEKALHLVSTAAAHANDAMKRIEKFKKLLEVQESLGGTVDLVSPTRELLKEGKIVKISARSGDHQDRYLFLFSDLLLLCSARLITNRVISGGGPAFRLRAKFDVDNMQVLEGDNLVTANTFYVRDDHKSVELYTQTRAEKEEWLEALFQVIKELYQRKSSLRIGREMLRPLDSEIGRRQPHLLKLDAINKCMECSQPFSMMRKKYNCRACGIVVCAKCSGQKFPLSFEDNKPCRVCKSCHQVLGLPSRGDNISNENNSGCGGSNDSNLHSSQTQLISKDNIDVQVRPKGLLEIPADSSSIKSGYLTLKHGGGGGKPVKRWFALLPDFVLYTFHNDSSKEALTATPMPGHTVLTANGLRGDSSVPEKDRDRVVKLYYAPNNFQGSINTSPVSVVARKIYYLAGTVASDVESWAEVLKLATRAETPSDSDQASNRNSMSSSSD